jgi:hypothetical protein
VLVQAKGFSCEAFYAVACYGGTEGSRRDAQTQPGMGFVVGNNRQAKKRIGEFFAAPFYVSKFGRLVQTLARLERQFTDLKASLRDRVTGRAFCGPWHGGGPAIVGRSWWPCARGNRGCGHDVNYWD